MAAEIGIGETTTQALDAPPTPSLLGGDTGAVLDADERAEFERLRHGNTELRLDRVLLKAAAAFFVSDQPVGSLRLLHPERLHQSVSHRDGLVDMPVSRRARDNRSRDRSASAELTDRTMPGHWGFNHRIGPLSDRHLGGALHPVHDAAASAADG
ncbi:hypothetical protein JF767_25650 [Mycobacterium intracellulare subsp. chimaera]|nr:hypothetical protein [Mycobacterium intracellulare subsp. chimaera]MCA2354595.1 hypothetical protein [Mycobacterium intracellulare subsp. chimaera]